MSNRGGEPSPFTSKGVKKSGEGLRPPRLRRIRLKQAGRVETHPFHIEHQEKYLEPRAS